MLWWLHGRYAAKALIGDVTAMPSGRVSVSFLPHFEVLLSPEGADSLAEALIYQARVARGERPPRRVDYQEDR